MTQAPPAIDSSGCGVLGPGAGVRACQNTRFLYGAKGVRFSAIESAVGLYARRLRMPCEPLLIWSAVPPLVVHALAELGALYTRTPQLVLERRHTPLGPLQASITAVSERLVANVVLATASLITSELGMEKTRAEPDLSFRP